MSSGAGQKIFQLGPVVTVANTRVPVSTGPLAVRSVILQAAPTNVGVCVVGDETVTSENGMLLGPGDSMTLAAENDSRYNDFDLSDVFILSTSSDNKVKVMGFKRRV